MSEDYNVKFEEEKMQPLNMFADLSEQDLLNYDTVDVLENFGTFLTYEDVRVADYLHFNKAIKGMNRSNGQLPNFYKSDIYTLLKDTAYSSLLIWDDATTLANITLLELFSFDIINGIWKALQTSKSVIVRYDKIVQDLGEHTSSVINFVRCALHYRGIIALDVTKYLKNKTLFVSTEHLDGQGVIDRLKRQEVVIRIVIQPELLSNNVYYNAYVYNLNSIPRIERSSKILKSYNENIYLRKTPIKDTLKNAKAVYVSGFNLLFAIINLYDTQVIRHLGVYNNEALDYLWSLLPDIQQKKFADMQNELSIIYDSTNGFTRMDGALRLKEVVVYINEFYEYVQQYFNSKLNCQACMMLTKEELVKLLIREFDLNKEVKEMNYENADGNFDDIQNPGSADDDITDEEEEYESEVIRPKSDKASARNPYKEPYQKGRDHESVADKAKRRFNEKRDNGEFKEMGRSVAHAGKTVGSKVWNFARKNPKTTGKLIGGLVIAWFILKIIRAIGSLF